VELEEDAAPGPMLRMRVLVTNDYKLAVFPPTGEGLLFDYKNDPHEQHNRWDDPEYSGIRAELIHQLLEELVWSDRLDMPRPCGS
jgi:arylsulfatase A-like enzyme